MLYVLNLLSLKTFLWLNLFLNYGNGVMARILGNVYPQLSIIQYTLADINYNLICRTIFMVVSTRLKF